MEKKRGRPPGPRKDGQQVRMILASDVVAIADQHVPQYGSRTASIEALVRLGERWSAAAAGAPTEPWIAKKQGPMYYGYVVIDGEQYFCDCSIRCRKCQACLGCLRKLAIDIDTGEITPTPCEKGGTHEPEWDTEPGAPLHPCGKITDGRAGTSTENPQASLKGEGGQTPRPGAGSEKANLSEPVRRLLDDPA